MKASHPDQVSKLCLVPRERTAVGWIFCRAMTSRRGHGGLNPGYPFSFSQRGLKVSRNGAPGVQCLGLPVQWLTLPQRK